MSKASEKNVVINGETHLVQVKKEVVNYVYETPQQEEDHEDYMPNPSPIACQFHERRSDTGNSRQNSDDGTPKKRSKKPRRVTSDMMYEYDTNFEVQSNPVMERAKKFEANLNPQFPSFIKLMFQSHVTKGFVLRLPRIFCKKYMPKHDESIVLVVENGEQYTVTFLVNQLAFSGGWIGFSHQHKLQEGDAVIFQLVTPFQFKVYIVRKNDELDHGMLDLPNLNEFMSSPFVDYTSFSIVVNGLSLDSELESVCHKYYELCFARKSYLHERLKTHNPRLAVEIISETVNVADAIRGCGISTLKDDFAIWDTMLHGFEVFGMDVEFLRSRLNNLMELALQFKDTPDFKRYVEAKLEQSELEKEIMSLERTTNRLLKNAKNVLQEEDIMTFETMLNRLKNSKNVVQSEIERLGVNVCRYEEIFEEIARAPW